jgi:hypothetical protein
MAALTPPVLPRDISALYSNQRDELTCAYHVFSKLLLKNVVELFYPLPIDLVYHKNNCNRYLDTQDIQLETLTPEECTQNGYLKIILFHYFYSLYDIHLNRKGQPKEAFSLFDIDVSNSYINRMFIPERVTHKKEITHTLSIVNHVKSGLGINYYKIIVYNKEGILDIIQKILSLGFYIGLALFDKHSHEEHARHAVHIVAIDEDEIIFKNSWGDERVYNMKVDDLKFKLGPYQFKIEYFLFYLPCKSPPPMEIVNSLELMSVFRPWVDEYVRQFPDMMARVPELIASVPASTDVPPPLTRSKTPTFEIGDIVTVEGDSTPLKISEKIRKGEYRVTYIDEYGDERGNRVFDFQLTKVGGSRRRTRKRIR